MRSTLTSECGQRGCFRRAERRRGQAQHAVQRIVQSKHFTLAGIGPHRGRAQKAERGRRRGAATLGQQSNGGEKRGSRDGGQNGDRHIDAPGGCAPWQQSEEEMAPERERRVATESWTRRECFLNGIGLVLLWML